MGTPTYKSAANNPTGATVTRPAAGAAWASGDYLIGFAPGTGSVSTPAGWTALQNTSAAAGGPFVPQLHVFGKISDGTETSVTFTSAYMAGVDCYSGMTSPSKDLSSFTALGTGGTTVVAPDITTTFADLVHYYCQTWGTSDITEPGSPFVKRQEFGSGDVSLSGDIIQGSSGATGTQTFTYNGTENPRNVIVVAIKQPAAAAASLLPRRRPYRFFRHR